ncbi:MAG TPA: helix-turn-helix domain-containing protein [Candidatus Pygmaiobacter gallistercoris]|nr:helix-turn-helix domain-containing protein [Candidatus Pygmaiobacter gallistercoris]
MLAGIRWIFNLALLALTFYLIFLAIRALRVYLRSKEVRREETGLRQNLGEVLRVENRMTQEFAAQTVGVSRQAASKWESGASDPSTANLIALAKLYQTTVEEILHQIAPEQ